MEIVREEWRTVPDYDGYEVSNHGRVRNARRGNVLKPISHKGYCIVKLGRPHLAFGIHRLVAWAFIGPQLPGMVVNHIDGCKTNNQPANLEIIPNSENVDHAYRTGLLVNRGKSNGRAILTESQVKEIKAGMPLREACERFGIGRHVVWKIKSGKTWRHVAAG